MNRPQSDRRTWQDVAAVVLAIACTAAPLYWGFRAANEVVRAPSRGAILSPGSFAFLYVVAAMVAAVLLARSRPVRVVEEAEAGKVGRGGSSE